jgi:hypothetical protein
MKGLAVNSSLTWNIQAGGDKVGLLQELKLLMQATDVIIYLVELQ